MRQRRHANGNSNAMASATAVNASEWGSSRTIPPNITSTLKGAGFETNFADFAAEPMAPVAPGKKETKSGAATARCPPTSCVADSRDALVGRRSNRRVQSARGTSNRPTGNIMLQSLGDKSLPKLRSPVNNTANLTSVTGKMNIKNSHRTFSSPSGVSHVQWAVKVAPTTPDIQPSSISEPAEVQDLRHLLQDRYSEKRSIRQAFLRWDSNKDGCLCEDELQDMLMRLGIAQALGPKKVDTILQYILATPTASLHYDDFCEFVFGPSERNKSAPAKSKLSSSFNKQPKEVSSSDPDCVVSLLRTKYESRRVHQVFRDWDIDKNGGVTLAEIENNLRRQGLRIAKPQLLKLFDTYDLDHDGRLLYDEFMRLVYGPVHEQRYSYLAAERRKKQQERQTQEGDPLEFLRRFSVPQEKISTTDDPEFRSTVQSKLKTFALRLNDAYAAFDSDHSGTLSYRELCHGLQQLGVNLTDREFLHLATRIDTDGNGEISFKEFCDAFGDVEASNQRSRTAPVGIKRDERVEKQENPKLKSQDSSTFRRRPAGIFNFEHLTRRTKIPTRCGRTPYASTKELIGGNQLTSTQFTTEAQLYGNGSSCRSTPAANVSTTLGPQEKQSRRMANVNRLQRLYTQMENYEAQAKPFQDSYNEAQERRTRTLRRHQERYNQHIEELRSRSAPARTCSN